MTNKAMYSNCSSDLTTELMDTTNCRGMDSIIDFQLFVAPKRLKFQFT